VLAALLALAGCKLIDQRTFEHGGATPAAADLARAERTKLPLATLAVDLPDVDWRTSLHAATRVALGHNPDLTFVVTTPIPTSAVRDVQDKYSKQGQDDATLVARELQEEGVAPEHIVLRLHGDAGLPRREVQVFVQ